MAGRVHVRPMSKGRRPAGGAARQRPAAATPTGARARPRRPARPKVAAAPGRRVAAAPGRRAASAARPARKRSSGAGARPATRRPGRAPRHSSASQRVRRDRFLVLGAAVVSAGVLAVGLPVRSFLTDHHALSVASSSLSQVRQENRQLTVEQAQLASNTELARLARKEYQMVRPGQHLYDVLPLAGSRPDGSPASAAAGDPGLGAPVAPSDSPTLHPDPGLTGTSPPSSSTGSAPGGALGGPPGGGSSSRPPGFWRRVADTLEFWR